MRDIKLYMCQDEYEDYKNGYSAYGIHASSYVELLKKHGKEMIDLNILVKVKPIHIKEQIKSIFGSAVIPGWYEVRRG